MDSLKKLFWVVVFTFGVLAAMILAIVGAACNCVGTFGEWIGSIDEKFVDAMNDKLEDIFEPKESKGK